MGFANLRVHVRARIIEFPQGTRPLYLRALDVLIYWAVTARARGERRWVASRVSARLRERERQRAEALAQTIAFPSQLSRPESR